MEQSEEKKMENSTTISNDAYFQTIQSRKKLPISLQETLTAAFASIPVSSFPQVPGGKVIEISADTTISDAVKVLSECNILSAPVTNPEKSDSNDWNERYLGIIDYSSIILWVLEGAVGPASVGGTTVVDKGVAKDAPMGASQLGDDFYKVIMQEPFKSTKVREIVKSFRSTPFLPVSTDSNMLTVLLLLSKYRMRNVPVIEPGQPSMKNFITQSAVVRGLEGCRGRDWFDSISSHPISDLGLPFMPRHQVVSIRSNELILEAFKRMKDNQIGGLPVVEGENNKIVGNLSMRDIRYLLLNPELFSNFRHLTVNDFMKTVASVSTEIEKVKPAQTCNSNSTLGEIIHDLASKSVHRLYVVSEVDEVIGVITLRDVISCFIYEPPNYFNDYLGFSNEELLKR